MDPESRQLLETGLTIIFFVSLIGIIVGFSYAQEYRREQAQEHADSDRVDVLRDMTADWARQYQQVIFAPVEAQYLGDLSQGERSTRPDEGYFGAADGKLIYFSHTSSTFSLTFPFESIRCLSKPDLILKEIKQQESPRSWYFSLHHERAGRWHVHVFMIAGLVKFTAALEPFGLALPDHHLDLGPLPALRLEQNIYGHWETKHTTTLYLTPDRLLYDWRTALHFAQLRGVGILVRPGVVNSPFLRLDYAAEGGAPHSVGFEMSSEHAYHWAHHLERVANLPAVTYSARKGKVQ